MAIVPKDWRNAASATGGGDTSTPLSAEALEDLEMRLGDYADSGSDAAVGLLSKVDQSIRAASGLGYVNHGVTAGASRPSGWAAVLWLGSVQPTNAVDGDIWIDTT